MGEQTVPKLTLRGAVDARRPQVCGEGEGAASKLRGAGARMGRKSYER